MCLRRTPLLSPRLPDGWHSLSGALSALEAAYLEEDEEREEKGERFVAWLGFYVFSDAAPNPHARTAQEEKGRRAVQNLKPWTT